MSHDKQQHDPFFRPIGEHVEDSDSPSTQQVDGQTDSLLPTEPGVPTDAQPRMVEEIESLCMACQKNGTTRLLLTYIPYFKEVIISSFSCDHCGNRNNEIQSAGQIQDKGVLYTVHCTYAKDLDRQVVKSEFATLIIPELELSIPPQRGQLTTVEGLLSDTVRDLSLDQPVRKHVAPEAHDKIEAILDRLRGILAQDADGNKLAAEDDARKFEPFSLRVDDPSGNSFIEFTGSIRGLGAEDNKWTKRDYPRTPEQNATLGLGAPPSAPKEVEGEVDPDQGGGFSKADGETEFENEEVLAFDGTCSSCSAPLKTLMKKVNIPYFKDIIIMSTNCDFCGYRDNEVKSGSAISERGRKLTLKVEDSSDLSRDLLKSESAGLSIPEIELHLNPGTLGGRFTTLEGLLQQVYDELSTRLMRGDSNRGESGKFEDFLGKLKKAMSAEVCPFTVVLDDPLANSYIQNPYAPDVDEQVTVEDYTRTFEQNEDLGLNDMKLEGYEADDKLAPPGSERRDKPDELEDQAHAKRAKLDTLAEADEPQHAAPPGVGKALKPLDDDEMA
ncbi:putative ZPR1-protein binds to translation elongation factor eEF-1 [Ceraceosorus guamensis]|uniref:Putative ZPR1-protein binds to translation elongation factor eEF-1 n=1 Tax=Ceraceosorus guamensis TaxID=1522189 RepID=A0A316W9J2_9BASI|nr:putative ZPR1-protein binds to translation elongation factor eEF-1 [Ceraceosorus guamensis]PWN44673.1 putative ZPR1-protein binds to translation elongation factor eEF-1 [Ceraceosorus guamensis]